MHDSFFQPELEIAFVRDVIQRKPAALERFARRITCVGRFLAAKNARFGRPLDDHDLADLAQDVAVIVFGKLDRFAGHAPLEGWVYNICSLEFMNTIRRRNKRPREFPDGNPDSVAQASTEHEADVERVQLALERVGGIEAETIRLKHFEGLSFEEIGARTKTSPNTVKTRYYRGLSQLERLLRPGEDQEERS